MYAILNSLRLFSSPLRKAGLCAIIGLIAGGTAGFFLLMLLLRLDGAAPALSPSEVVRIGLELAAGDVVILLVLLAGMLRYRLASIFFPVVAISLVTCLSLVALVNAFGLWTVSTLVGVVIGFIVGRTLCVIACRIRE